jgi:hypothetical protein
MLNNGRVPGCPGDCVISVICVTNGVVDPILINLHWFALLLV